MSTESFDKEFELTNAQIKILTDKLQEQQKMQIDQKLKNALNEIIPIMSEDQKLSFISMFNNMLNGKVEEVRYMLPVGEFASVGCTVWKQKFRRVYP
jgi:thiamine biosynthesis lipoprotein ApbE